MPSRWDNGEDIDYLIQLDEHLEVIYKKYKDKFLNLIIDSIARDMSKFCDLIKYRVNPYNLNPLEAKLYFNCRNMICVWITIDLTKSDITVLAGPHTNNECEEWII